MIVKLRNPSRDVVVEGPALVSVVLQKLEINRESVLVIRNGEIIPNDTRLEDDDVIEIRPVISGGAFGPVPSESSPCVGSEVQEP